MTRRKDITGSRAIRGGVLADGCFKLALAATYAVFVVPFGAWLEAPRWLVILAALLLTASGIAEVLASSRPERRHVLFLVAYDLTWLVISLVALILASRGAPDAGTVWLVFQIIGSAALSVLFSIRYPRLTPTHAQSRGK